MARENSLNYELTARALAGNGKHAHKASLSDETVKSYKRNIKQFSDFAKSEYGIKRMSDLDMSALDARDIVQTYAQTLELGGATAGTIHTKIAPVCKALDIGMQEIEKPKRISAENIRGRYQVERSIKEMALERYAPSVELQKALGIRRNELINLTGQDLIESKKGLYVVVKRGKGGKLQLQRVLPQHEAVVRSAFERISDNERVLKPETISKNINYHHIRADVAKEAYAYYTNRLNNEPEYAQKLTDWLERKFLRANKNASEKAFARFKSDMRNEPYVLRGANKQLALQRGLPIEYNRLALMAVSVEHLSHWRLDVTVSNYILA